MNTPIKPIDRKRLREMRQQTKKHRENIWSIFAIYELLMNLFFHLDAIDQLNFLKTNNKFIGFISKFELFVKLKKNI